MPKPTDPASVIQRVIWATTWICTFSALTCGLAIGRNFHSAIDDRLIILCACAPGLGMAIIAMELFDAHKNAPPAAQAAAPNPQQIITIQ